MSSMSRSRRWAVERCAMGSSCISWLPDLPRARARACAFFVATSAHLLEGHLRAALPPVVVRVEVDGLSLQAESAPVPAVARDLDLAVARHLAAAEVHLAVVALGVCHSLREPLVESRLRHHPKLDVRHVQLQTAHL